jgi:hypothetical protein
MMKAGDPGFGGLKVCPACGWHALIDHAERCEPLAGKRASDLMAALPEVPSTKLGYGAGNVTFEPEELPDSQSFHVRFEVSDRENEPRPFSVREVWLLDDLSQEEAASLVRAVVEWRKTTLARRGVYSK